MTMELLFTISKRAVRQVQGKKFTVSTLNFPVVFLPFVTFLTLCVRNFFITIHNLNLPKLSDFLAAFYSNQFPDLLEVQPDLF